MSKREHRRSAERVVGGRAPVLLESQDLPAERARVLRPRLLLTVARRDVELAVRSERDPAAVVIRRSGDVVEEDGLVRSRPVRVVHAHKTIERRATRCGVRVVEVDEAGPREVGIEREPEKAALRVGIRSRRKCCPRLRFESAARTQAHDPHAARSLGDEEPPVGRERHRPRRLESRGDELHVFHDGGTDPRRGRGRGRSRSHRLRGGGGRDRGGRGRRLSARDERRERARQPAPHGPRCAQRRSAWLAMGRASR